MWLDIIIAASCGFGGIISGWIMYAIGGFGNRRWAKQAAAAEGRADDPNRERVTEAAQRLRSYAVSMAADVDAHQTRVQAVNNSLSGDQQPGSNETVFEAVNQLIEANEEMQAQLQQAQDRIHNQSVQIETAERRAHTDALTRVPNRGAFDAHLLHRHEMGAGKAGTLALLDVDHFKQFNDVYGHRAGDEVLRVVAKVLHARLHSHGIVARFGGEEFAIVMDGQTVEEAKDLIESARMAIGERDIQFEDKRLRVAASAGVAELSDGESIEQWLQRADDGLYRSKEAGRNCGHWMNGEKAVRICLGQDESLNSAISLDSNASPMDGELDVPESVADRAAARKDARSFAYLPDRKVLGDVFTDLRSRTQSISMYVMSVRCHDHSNKSVMRSLLQIVRATLRSVDRIGCEDDWTILVCMPSVDESTALERGKQIRRSADAVKLNGGDRGSSITIGLAPVGTDQDFQQVVSRSNELAQMAYADGSEPVLVEGPALTARGA